MELLILFILFIMIVTVFAVGVYYIQLKMLSSAAIQVAKELKNKEDK